MRAAALILAAGLALPGCGGGAEGGGGPPRLVVGTEAAYPPFEFVDAERRIVGFDVDLVRAAAREAGFEAVFVDQPFDGLIPGLQQGKYDAAVSAMTITPERAEVVAFTDGYYDAGQVIAVREGTTGISTPADLAGKVVAVQANTTGHRQAERIAGAEVRSFPSIEPAFMELAAGRADAVINDDPTTFLYAREHGGIRIVGAPFTEEQYGIAVRRDDAALLAKLNEGLRRVRASGEYDRLRKVWIEGKPPLAAGALGVLVRALGLSLQIAACSLAVALALGLLVALCRMSPRPWLRWPATAYVEIVRGVPLIVLLFWIYFGVFSDLLSRTGIALHGFAAAVLAFGICYSAFIGETYRAGIQSVDRGQEEAARALGLSRRRSLRWVILPQAVRNVLPALGNEAIALFKDSSLASVIAMPELMHVGRQEAGRTFRTMEIFTVVALLYLVVTLALSRVQKHLERRFGAGTLDTDPRHH